METEDILSEKWIIKPALWHKNDVIAYMKPYIR
jgi:hypothetical protein